MTLIGGRYELGALLASGAAGEVHVARDLELGLDVVVKSRRIDDADHLERLRREAGTVMRLVAHGGLPTVRSDLVEGDRYHLITDHIAGRHLRSIVEAQEGSGLALSNVLGLVDQIAAVLDHLHGHHPPVVHGGVEPENVIVMPDGRVVLVDLGSAMRIDTDRERSGTPGFSAPEILAGEPLSPAADVYSLTALAVYLLTGVEPRVGAAWSDRLAQLDLGRLERVLRGGLSWEPSGRPWTASEQASRLRDAAELDVPVGTVTLLAAAGPRGLIRPEVSGGRPVTTVSVPHDVELFAFSRASDAATAALALADTGIGAVALHAGDLGGWHGATLQQLAESTVGVLENGEREGVTVSPSVKMLLGNDDAFSLEPGRSGLAIVRRPTTPGGRYGTDLDAQTERVQQWIEARRARPVAGRSGELARAHTLFERERALDLAPSLVVTGEAGIGKTRFLVELADAEQRAGRRVVVGRCTEAGGAFEPFLDALGDAVFGFGSSVIERDEEGWADRRRFFGRIAAALGSLEQPVTLVIDDAQWIDGSSLALLGQLLDDMGDRVSAIIGCRSTAPAGVLASFTDRPGSHLVALRPLDRVAVEELAVDAGVEADSVALDDLLALTGGNPFFLLQLLSHVREQDEPVVSSGSLPPGVREWVLQRVERLGLVDALSVAAVTGRSFDLVVVADVMGAGPLELLADLDRAVEAGLVHEDGQPGRFRFVHALVNATLDEHLSSSRRALLHAAIGRRLEEGAADLDTLEEAMYHWLAAGRLGDPLHAGDLAVEVANHTTERLAHEQAMAITDRALAVLAEAPRVPVRDRVEARLRLARGRSAFVAGHNLEGFAQLRRAVDLAETGDDPLTLAEAALVASLNRRHGLDDPELLDLLELASERCPDEPAVLAAMLHVRRARLLPIDVRHEDRSAMARRGLVALDSMDAVDRATVETEVARACWNPDDAAERDALMTRLVLEAERHVAGAATSRWTGVLIEALNHRWAARVQLGEVRAALADADAAAVIADEAGTTFLLSRVRMGQAMIHATLGDDEEAERLATDAVSMSNRHNLQLGRLAVGYSVGRNQGRQAALSRLEHQLADLVDSNPMFLAAFALVHAEAGQLDDAARLVQKLEEWAPWPRNWVWLATTTALLETTVILGDHDRTRRFLAVLQRYSGQWAMAAAELTCLGPVDRVLGVAHAALGDAARAEHHLRAARASAITNDAAPWTRRCDDALAELARAVSP